VLFITGYHASGKSYMADILSQGYDLLHIETSSIVRGFKAQDDPEAPMPEWAREKESQYGQNFFDDLIVSTVRSKYAALTESGKTPQDIVITGNRSLGGILYATEQLQDLQEDHKPNLIVVVESDIENLYERYRTRNRRPGDEEMTFEVFESLLKQEEDAGIREIFEHADYRIFNNDDANDFRNTTERFATDELGLLRTVEGDDLYTEIRVNHPLR
jgi:dephospho-CoA kinase